MPARNLLLLIIKRKYWNVDLFVEDIYILLTILLANVNSRLRSLYVVVRPSVRLSVCRLSVTFVHPTQVIEIFGNVSTPLGTLAICDLLIKILRSSSQGNPSDEGLNQRGAAKYSDFGPLQGYISKMVLRS